MTTIVVIDDEMLVRTAISMVLSRAGYTVFDAETGQEGLALIAEHQPDALITDLFMPDMDGFAIIENVKSEFPKTPIIALTGGARLGQENMLTRAKELGAAVTLTKPVDRMTLLDTVKDILGN